MNTLPKDIKNILISYNKSHPLADIMRPSMKFYIQTERYWLGWSYSTWIQWAKNNTSLKLDEKSFEDIRKRMKESDYEYIIIND